MKTVPIDHSVTAVATTASMFSVATVDDTVFLVSSRGEKLRSFDASPATIQSLSFSPDGKVIAIAANSFAEPIALRKNRIVLLDALSAAVKASILRVPQENDTSEIQAVAFSPCGKYLAACTGQIVGKGGYLVLWDVDSRKELVAFRAHSKGLYCLAFSADSKQLATGGYDSLVKVWNLEKILTARADR
jgi:WD40 repeat protein